MQLLERTLAKTYFDKLDSRANEELL